MTPSERARRSLEGLSVGDAFGERFFGDPEEAMERIERREVPPGRWRYTDDTEMAISLVEVLAERGDVERDLLVECFVRRMDQTRGYGAGTYRLLRGVGVGAAWRELARTSFDGRGSFGNGAAMRVAPLGAFFADAELPEIVRQASASAEVTHAHAEGIAGAVAVAVAAATAWRARAGSEPLGSGWIETVRDATPAGYTRDAISEALGLGDETTTFDAAVALGNGSGITAPDTVPLCLWVAARWSRSYEEAMWQTVSALGDRDTTCAIVGGIVSLADGASIPPAWLEAREPLP